MPKEGLRSLTAGWCKLEKVVNVSIPQKSITVVFRECYFRCSGFSAGSGWGDASNVHGPRRSLAFYTPSPLFPDLSFGRTVAFVRLWYFRPSSSIMSSCSRHLIEGHRAQTPKTRCISNKFPIQRSTSFFENKLIFLWFGKGGFGTSQNRDPVFCCGFKHKRFPHEDPKAGVRRVDQTSSMHHALCSGRDVVRRKVAGDQHLLQRGSPRSCRFLLQARGILDHTVGCGHSDLSPS